MAKKSGPEETHENGHTEAIKGTIPYTLDSLQDYLGEHYFVKESRQGNYQVNLGDIRSLSDDDKLTMLYKGRQKLRAAGFEVSAKFTYRNQGTGRFENWPCLWVDPGVVSQISQVKNLTKMVQRVFAALEDKGYEIPVEILEQFGTADEFEDTRELAPDDTSFEHAASIRMRQNDIAAGRNIRKNVDPTTRPPTLNQPSPGVARQKEEDEEQGRRPSR